MSFSENPLKHFEVYALDSIDGRSVAAFTLPSISRPVFVYGFGVTETSNSSISFFLMFAVLGYNTVLKEPLLVDSNITGKKREIISITFRLLVILENVNTVILHLTSLLTRTSRCASSKYVRTMRVAYSNVLVGSLQEFFFTLFRINFRLMSFPLFSFSRSLIENTLVAVFALFLGIVIDGCFLGTLLLFSTMLIIETILARMEFTLFLDFKIITKLLKYSGPLLGGSLAYWIFNLSDIIVINSRSTADELRIYSMAVQMISILPFVAIGFKYAWTPRDFDYYKTSNPTFLALLNRRHFYGITFFDILSLAEMTFVRLLFFIPSTNVFIVAKTVLRPLSIVNALYPLHTVGTPGICLSGKPTYSTIYSRLFALLHLIIKIALSKKRLGAVLASISSSVSYFILYVSNFNSRSSQKLLNWKAGLRKLLTIIILSISSILKVNLFESENVFLS